MTRTSTPHLEWTGNEAADRLISTDATALVIGFCLDQQIPIEKAFTGPLLMLERLGTLDPAKLAAIPEADFVAAFRTPPAIHRFPQSMALRVQNLCRVLADDYGNDPRTIWSTASDAEQLRQRFAQLPGFGPMKARIMVAVVANHLGIKLKGVDRVRPDFPSLADVSTREQRLQYQAQKRAHKAAARQRDGAQTR